MLAVRGKSSATPPADVQPNSERVLWPSQAEEQLVQPPAQPAVEPAVITKIDVLRQPQLDQVLELEREAFPPCEQVWGVGSTPTSYAHSLASVPRVACVCSSAPC